MKVRGNFQNREVTKLILHIAGNWYLKIRIYTRSDLETSGEYHSIYVGIYFRKHEETLM